MILFNSFFSSVFSLPSPSSVFQHLFFFFNFLFAFLFSHPFHFPFFNHLFFCFSILIPFLFQHPFLSPFFSRMFLSFHLLSLVFPSISFLFSPLSYYIYPPTPSLLCSLVMSFPHLLCFVFNLLSSFSFLPIHLLPLYLYYLPFSCHILLSLPIFLFFFIPSVSLRHVFLPLKSPVPSLTLI